jgi:ribosomal-protein-alanine N-acetyltransferase
MPYQVRPLRRDDIAQIDEIDREAYPNWWPPSNYESELNNSLAHYLVLYETNGKTPNGRPDEWPISKASALGRILEWLLHPGKSDPLPPSPPAIIGFTGFWIMAGEAHITTIAVRQSHRGRGAGELLLLSAIELASQLAVTVVTLEVRASNTAAQRLYEKYRFNRVGQRRAYYTDNREDAFIMTTEAIASDSFQAHLKHLKETYALKATPPQTTH